MIDFMREKRKTSSEQSNCISIQFHNALITGKVDDLLNAQATYNSPFRAPISLQGLPQNSSKLIPAQCFSALAYLRTMLNPNLGAGSVELMRVLHKV